MRLKTNRLIVINKGAKKIKDRNSNGELSDIGKPPHGLTNPLLANKKSQKKANMILIEPTSSPNARGSLSPPLTGIEENAPFGENITEPSVRFMLVHNPT